MRDAVVGSRLTASAIFEEGRPSEALAQCDDLGLAEVATWRTTPTQEKIGYELEVIAMVVIGGTVLTGGRGTIFGTVLGIFILRSMRNGIVLIGVPGLAYNIFIGAIILGMMALHSWLERRHNAGT